MATRLDVRNISVQYQRKRVVHDISFCLEEGTIACLLGPSGCGKTTLLRAIAGFEPLSTGEILLHGHRVSGSGYTLAPEKRRVGMVFQDLALFPHMNVAENIRFGIREQPKSQQKTRIQALLRLVGLSGHADQYPHQLSGGQQQRVALARAMTPQPEILLLDEPFSSIDVELREQLAIEVRDILKLERMTAILVTHDQHEAFAFADEIGVMNQGRIAQWDTAYNLYHRPANRFVADFIGLGVMLSGKVLNDHQVETELGVLSGPVDPQFQDAEPVEILVRPDDVIHDDASDLMATVEEKHFRGAEFLYKLRLPSGSRVLCYAPSHHDHRIGEPIGIEIDAEHLVMFKRPLN